MGGREQPIGWECYATRSRDDIHQIRFTTDSYRIYWGCTCQEVIDIVPTGTDPLWTLYLWRQWHDSGNKGNKTLSGRSYDPRSSRQGRAELRRSLEHIRPSQS